MKNMKILRHYLDRMGDWKKPIFTFFMFSLLFSGCARMGNPDGGWYDETPPKVIGSNPSDKGTHVTSKKINIYFDEFINIDNPTENVVVSPPQLEAPEIKSMGKHIQIALKDSLKENTTYTVDFSDAISDNNENNPLGNYTYSFSTGDQIDTLEVSGCVLDAENLEPIKGILVGLYKDMSAEAFNTQPMLRVSKTDSRGHFVIKGVAPGMYHINALQDADGNYMFNQKSEKIAFSEDVIMPSSKPDTRQDTIWADSLHIKAITPTGYTHFLPDNIVLKAFTENLTDRYFLKQDRLQADHFSMYFSYGNDQLPVIRGLNFNEKDAFIIETSLKKDTLTYWLKDTALVNQDTLRMEVSYLMTDSLGKLVNNTDTMEVLSKDPFARRQRKLQKDLEKWQKEQNKKKEKGEPYEKEMPKKALAPVYEVESEIRPDQNLFVKFNTPLEKVDTSAIHLYAKHDSLWYRAPYEVEKTENRTYMIRGEWRPDIEYSLEIDSAAFTDIYGNSSIKFKKGFKVKNLDEFSSLFVTIQGFEDSMVVVQLLDASDNVVKQVATENGVAEFYYLTPGQFYMRMFVDRNKNGLWDTGDYRSRQQAESVYYYPREIECRAKWDVTETWNPLQVEINKQKPSKITKQKPDKERKIQDRNARRAREMGIKYIPKK